MDLSNKPRRLPRDINRGPCQTTTEFREKYRNRGGGPSDGQKNPDNLKNGPRFYKDTAYGQQFKTTKGNARVKNEWDTSKDLHGRIKDSHGGKYIRVDKNHPDRKVGARPRADLDLGPSGFAKDRWTGDNLPLNNGNAMREHYPGHYKGHARKQDQRFDNLHSHPNIKGHKYTTTGRHHVPKNRQRELDRGCEDMNRAYDRTTEQIKPNARVDKITTQNHFHHPKNAEINGKTHTGQDYVANKQLGQIMGGYYYEGEA